MWGCGSALTQLSFYVPALRDVLLRGHRVHPLGEAAVGGDGVGHVAEGRQLLGDVVHAQGLRRGEGRGRGGVRTKPITVKLL